MSLPHRLGGLHEVAEIKVVVAQSVSVVPLSGCKKSEAGFSQGVTRMTDAITVKGGICSVSQRNQSLLHLLQP